MAGHVGSLLRSKHRKLERFAPLLAAAALLCAGCVPEDSGSVPAAAERSLVEQLTPHGAPSAAAGGEQAGAARSAGEPDPIRPPAQSGSHGLPPAGENGALQPLPIPGASAEPSAAIPLTPAAESGSAAGHTASAAGNAAAAATAGAVSSAQPRSQAGAKQTAAPKFSIPVLNYHSIGVEPDNNAVLDPKKLDEQMAHLSKEGYTALTLQQFIGIWDGHMEAPAKPVLLTFDDGYTDNYTEAMPILRKYGFTATMFVSPGMTGQDGYFAEWEQIREMRDAGWDIQPHGMSHPYMHKLPLDKQRYEIAESIKQLKEQTGLDTYVFCYPYGMRNGDTLKLLEESKVRFAFTIDQGRTEPSQNPLLLKRIFVGGKESMDTFLKKLKP
ncbi:polysaccharide deacetylase family protein [Paenibacillus ginsengarvi]|uniref:polysaccharide deacetylase family protein n=1 Tax=Paenibacillus ginsengarvi TaxID=400777 RepID=UPI001F00D104|nr:polysaccharide deacetylase family protein [Paenibacillus ginsengarvi]